MRIELPSDKRDLLLYVPEFLKLMGSRWPKRIGQLVSQHFKSPYLLKIIDDYHWLEMSIDHCEGIRLGEVDMPERNARIGAALRFVAGFVEIRNRVTERAQKELDGRLRDGLNSDTAFASLYLEVDTALKLMAKGYEVTFVDLERSGTHDLKFGIGDNFAEVECKSLTMDSGRQIRRNDFYRLIDPLHSSLMNHRRIGPGLVVVTLPKRLLSSEPFKDGLRRAICRVLERSGSRKTRWKECQIEWRDYAECFDKPIRIQEPPVYKQFQEVFGQNVHVAGAMSSDSALVVMRSEREDDTSKPWLTAMRKAASQLSGNRPGFIAVQLNDVKKEDLLLPHLRRRAGILSGALFWRYGADHVNAVQVSGYDALVANQEEYGSPAFVVPNPKPTHPIDRTLVASFLEGISDADFADALGVPRPTVNI